ncbi:MAG: hypothetical protein IK085_09510 [Clostridia bacterium]|nr:hypothetical protein [Clostridia bacterium]
MKRLITLLLAATMIIVPLSVCANAEGERTIVEIGTTLYPVKTGTTLLRIVLNSKYVSFGDDIVVKVISEGYSHETTSKVYSGDSLVCLFEKDRKTKETNPVIYVKDSLEPYHFGYVIIKENSVFDNDGNGNPGISYSTPSYSTYRLSSNPPDSQLYMEKRYVVGQDLTFYFAFPVDFYYDGELIGENTDELKFTFDKTGDHLIEVYKFGILIEKYEFHIEYDDPVGRAEEQFGYSVDSFLTSLSLFPFSGVFGMFFPILGYAAFLGPFLSGGNMVASFFNLVASWFN